MQGMNVDDDQEMEGQLLDELMELARGGMAKDMRQRYGKADPSESVEELPEDPDIPGVQTSAQDDGMGEAEPDGDEAMGQDPAEGGELDQNKLRALLAAMKAGGAGA